METITNCPVCNKTQFQEYLRTKDHFLTREEFTISECISCGFRFTNPRPDESSIQSYYDSPDYIAHDASSFSPVQFLYTTARKFALGRKYSLITTHTEGKNLLDIGCGTGEFLSFCRKRGFNVSGVEPGDKARNFAVSKYSLPVFPVSELDRFPSGSFNVITLWHVLEHVHNLGERMSQLHKLLGNTGLLIIAVPNCNSYDASRYGPHWAAYDLPRHLYHFNPETMKQLVENCGFILEKTLPLKLDAFYISLLSEKYESGRQKYFSAFINGLHSNRSARKNSNNYSSLVYLCRKRLGAK